MLPALAAEAVQLAAIVGPVVTVLHVVVVQLLPEAAAAGAHDATKVGPVATVLHVVPV